MFSTIIKWLFKSIIGRREGSILILLGEVFSIAITLYLFKMTSALVPVEKLQNSSANYFEFLLIGEIALLLPLSYIETSIRLFTSFISSGFIQTLKSNQINPYKVTIKIAMREMWRPLLRMIFILVGGVMLLETKISSIFYMNFILSQILTMLAMIVLSELVMAAYECYRRGLKMFYSLNSVLAIIGGAYFPVSYLSPIIKEYAVWLFPQTMALQFARQGVSSGPIELGFKYLYYIVYIVFLALLAAGIKKYMKRRIIQKRLSHLTFS